MIYFDYSLNIIGRRIRMLNILMNNFVEIVLGFIITFLTYLYRKLINYNKMIQYIKDGIKALLKNKIIEKYHYHKEIGTITIFDKQLISDLYREYHNLDGNGIIDDLMDEINNLPISNNYNNINKKTIQKE